MDIDNVLRIVVKKTVQALKQPTTESQAMGLKIELYGLTPDEVIAVMKFVKENGIGDRTPGERVVVQPRAAASDIQQWDGYSPAAVHAEQQSAAAPAPQPAQQPQVQPQAAPTPQQTAPADLDAFGVPYNEKLHSSRSGPTKGQNQNGSWKMRKGANRAEYDQWATEHKQAANAPQDTAWQQPQTATPGQSFGGGDGAAPGQSFGGGGAWPGQPAQPAQGFEVTVQDFVNKCTELANLQLLTDANINRVKTAIKCWDDATIQNDPTLRTAACAELDVILREAA